jgi:uncharacterized protein (DUF2147 family)
MRRLSLAIAALVLATGAAYADPIEGNWKTQSGETAAISGGGSFTIVLKTGKYAGKRIGSLKSSGANKYAGTITDPADDKTYSGSARLSGSTLKMTGVRAESVLQDANLAQDVKHLSRADDAAPQEMSHACTGRFCRPVFFRLDSGSRRQPN